MPRDPDVAERAEAARLDVVELERASGEGMPEPQPPTWRVAVVGSPTFTDGEVMRSAIEHAAPRRILAGTGAGAEALARAIAADSGIPLDDAPPGSSEGLLERADAVLVFVGPGELPAHLAELMRDAERKGLTATVFYQGQDRTTSQQRSEA